MYFAGHISINTSYPQGF